VGRVIVKMNCKSVGTLSIFSQNDVTKLGVFVDHCVREFLVITSNQNFGEV
jgi:hypothetical protein